MGFSYQPAPIGAQLTAIENHGAIVAEPGGESTGG
jgi:hypothetical protein